MKLTGTIKSRKVTPLGLRINAEVDGVLTPLRIFIPIATEIKDTGVVTIDIPEAVEKPKVSKPKAKKGKK